MNRKSNKKSIQGAEDEQIYVGTAEEIMRDLRSDPEWAAREAQMIKEQDDLESEIRRAEQPLLLESARVGIDAADVFEIESVERSPRAIALIIDMLTRTGLRRETREGLAHLLDFRRIKALYQDVLRLVCAESDVLVIAPLTQALCHGLTQGNLREALAAIEA